MTQIEQDRRLLSKTNPTRRFQVIGLNAIALVFLILAMTAPSDQTGSFAILVALNLVLATMATMRYFLIDPLIREVRRLRDELDRLRQPKESAS